MRPRYRSGTGTVLGALGLLSVTAVAAAARPESSANFSGSGRLCQNNAPHHRYTGCNGRDSFSFGTSSNGSRVLRFAGRIGPLYCGGGTATISAVFISVSSGGSFDYRFTRPNRGPSGKVIGRSTAEIRGRFSGGATASVFYRLVSHINGTPSGQDCGAQVSGTAHAH